LLRQSTAFASVNPHCNDTQTNQTIKRLDVRGLKGPEWFGVSLTMEDHMKLVTRFGAASRSTEQLHGLFREAFNAFSVAPRGSQERQDALQSMRNIEDEIATRAPGL